MIRQDALELNKIEKRKFFTSKVFSCWSKSNLKEMHLRPSDISRRLYYTSRPLWWSHRCPRHTNERPLKRDKKREKNAIDFYYCYSSKTQNPKVRFVRRYEIVFSFHARFFRELVISVSLRPYSRPRILGKAFILYLRSVVIDNSFLEENNREGLSSYVAIVFHKLSRILCVTITQILIGNKIFRKRGY